MVSLQRPPVGGRATFGGANFAVGSWTEKTFRTTRRGFISRAITVCAMDWCLECAAPPRTGSNKNLRHLNESNVTGNEQGSRSAPVAKSCSLKTRKAEAQRINQSLVTATRLQLNKLIMLGVRRFLSATSLSPKLITRCSERQSLLQKKAERGKIVWVLFCL